MTQDDAITYLRSIRDDYASRLHLGIMPKKQGDWIPLNKRDYYNYRISALDTAIVFLATSLDKPANL
jgi:hypothetical protein